MWTLKKTKQPNMAETKELKLYTLPEQETPVNEVVSNIVSSAQRNLIQPMQMQQNYMQSANFVTGSAGWKIDAAGNLEANAGTFRGALVANSIDIPNTTTADSFHVESDGDTWWGANIASGISVATASVTKAGVATFKSVILSTSVAISGIANNTSTDISLLSNTHSLTFSASDLDTVAWTSGTITLSNGRTFTIDAGNTGNISARTYIYLDPATSSTVLQVTTTVATAHGANKIPLAVAVNSTDKAEFVVFGGTGGRNLLVDNIAANSTSTNEFVSNTAQIKNLIVTNAKINDLAVSKLTAGTITSQSINLAVTDAAGDVEIRSGIATGDFANTGAASGFIIGVDDSDSNLAKFYFGNTTGNVQFDGTTFSVTGISQVTKSYTAGEAIAAGAGVFLENAATDISKLDINNAGTLGDSQVGRTSPNPQKAAQIINESSSFRVSKINVFVKKTGTPTDNLKIGIQTSSGSNPSGTFLASATLGGGSITTSYVEYTFTLDAEVDITGGTEYAVVAERSGSLDGSNYYNIRYETTSNVYTGGIAVSLTGAGPTWNGLLRDWDLELLLTTVAGRVYNASARNTAESNAFIGFNKTAVAGAASATIVISGEITGLSGLTTGTQYYLSDTFGALSTTVGTVTRKAAISTSTTSALLTNVW
jgi:acetyltransferase-like isoleucine patch superfamily enzyme